MIMFNIDEAMTHFPKLLEHVMNGEEVVIVKAGKPIARILPSITNNTSPCTPGIDKGKVIIQPDFDEPLPMFDQ
jgi:prevent-host-death family protein